MNILLFWCSNLDYGSTIPDNKAVITLPNRTTFL